MIFGLLAGVYLLPADTSLSEVRRGAPACLHAAGLSAARHQRCQCRPASMSIAAGAAREARAEAFDHAQSAIGQDFNPRNWRVTRAQCEVLPAASWPRR
jgi:polar amino acid transport system substrate-binding protein/cystine transport system substrate-binding protein/membrane-bound lytic murein transglycosylase F